MNDDTAGTIDVHRLRSWLDDSVEPITSLEIGRLAGGNSSGAWRLDLTTADGRRSLVLKAPNDEGLVFDCDASREARILQAAGNAGAPVATVVAVDGTGDVLGVPCFVMDLVEGHSVPDGTPASFHDDGWFRDADDTTQGAVWRSFIDALASLHSTDARATTVASHGPNGLTDVLSYWRRSLLDAAPADLVPRQLAVLDWLDANMPPGAGEAPTLCMGDARLGNALLDGTTVHTLVDFEVAYIGNPAADIGYCLMHEAFTRLLSDRPATGIPSADETWDRWGASSGRCTDHRDYWTAFGTTILCITGTRAMLKWGMPIETIDTDNIVVPEWEALIERATR